MSEETKETEIGEKVPDSTLDEQVGETIHETEDGKQETEEWKKILAEMETKRTQDWEAFLDQRKAEREELLNRLSAVEEDREKMRELLENMKNQKSTETIPEKIPEETKETQETLNPVIETTEVETEKPENRTRKRRRTIF